MLELTRKKFGAIRSRSNQENKTMKEIDASTKKERKLNFSRTYFKVLNKCAAATLEADAYQAIGN